MIKIIDGDFPKQKVFIEFGRIDLKTKNKKRVRYLLRSAIQDLEKVSEKWWKITYKVTMKDGKHLICSSDKKSFNKLYMEKEGLDKKNDYVSKNINIFQTFSFLKLASIIVIVIFLSSVIELPKSNPYKPNTVTTSQDIPAIKAQENSVVEPLLQEITNPKNKIAEYAVRPITKSGYPTTYKTWGASKISHINKLQDKAALKIAESDNCDLLEILGLSTDRSSPPNKIVFFADCANGQRFYISEGEIASSDKIISKNDKLSQIKDDEAEKACIDRTKAMLNFPSSFDFKALSLNVNRGMTGNIAVTFDFNAKNGLGIILPQKARCIIDDKGIHPVDVSNR